MPASYEVEADEESFRILQVESKVLCITRDVPITAGDTVYVYEFDRRLSASTGLVIKRIVTAVQVAGGGSVVEFDSQELHAPFFVSPHGEHGAEMAKVSFVALEPGA